MSKSLYHEAIAPKGWLYGPTGGPPRMARRRSWRRLVSVNIDLALTIALAAVWSVAGLLADGLPAARDARALRRSAGALLLAVGAGIVAVVAVAVQEQSLRGVAPLAAAAVVVVFAVVPRLNRMRRGARAFDAAPHAPMPPALRAAAAHPMVALPVQLAAIVAVVSVTGLAAAAVLGVALTAAGLVAVAIGVRHGLRHSRLAEVAVAIRPERSAVAIGR
jgi:hypothetical protein